MTFAHILNKCLPYLFGVDISGCSAYPKSVIFLVSSPHAIAFKTATAMDLSTTF